MNLIDNDLLTRIRATILRVGQRPLPAEQPVAESEDRTRTSIRQLSRTRVSHLLRQLRAAQGLTYGQVQEQTGLAQQMLYDFEYKDRRLSFEELRILTTCYGVSVNDVLGVDLE